MTVAQGLLITLASLLVCSAVGTLVGWTLGILAPDYYRVVLRIPPGVPLDLAQIGMGLGLTQGAIAGLMVGLVTVMSVAWFNSRRTPVR